MLWPATGNSSAAGFTVMKKILLLAAGNLFLALGVAGIFLPLLPTTPFLLLSAACFLRSSPGLYRRLVNHRVLGLYIRSYVLYRAVSLRGKILSIAALWAVITSTALFFVDVLWVRILLFVIASGVTIHLVLLKTLTREMRENLKVQEGPEAPSGPDKPGLP